jgi:hypothetical protein
MASGPRLWKLADQRDDTSPFLHGFAPPLYLGPLSDEAAREIARRCGADSAIVEKMEEILRRSGRHPTLLQMLCARVRELGDLDRATESVAADPTVRFFFAVDFDLLTPSERETVLGLARNGVSPSNRLEDVMHLERLGLVRRAGDGRLAIANPIFRQWLLEQADQNV